MPKRANESESSPARLDTSGASTSRSRPHDLSNTAESRDWVSLDGNASKRQRLAPSEPSSLFEPNPASLPATSSSAPSSAQILRTKPPRPGHIARIFSIPPQIVANAPGAKAHRKTWLTEKQQELQRQGFIATREYWTTDGVVVHLRPTKPHGSDSSTAAITPNTNSSMNVNTEMSIEERRAGKRRRDENDEPQGRSRPPVAGTHVYAFTSGTLTLSKSSAEQLASLPQTHSTPPVLPMLHLAQPNSSASSNPPVAPQKSLTDVQAPHSSLTTSSPTPQPVQANSRTLFDSLPPTPISPPPRRLALLRTDTPEPALPPPQPVTPSTSSVPVASTSQPAHSQTVLFVAGLASSIDDAGLAALFTDAGIKVDSARIARRKAQRSDSLRSAGFGFVDVGSEEEQKRAIATLHGKEVAGRAISVEISVSTRGHMLLPSKSSSESPQASHNFSMHLLSTSQPAQQNSRTLPDSPKATPTFFTSHSLALLQTDTPAPLLFASQSAISSTSSAPAASTSQPAQRQTEVLVSNLGSGVDAARLAESFKLAGVKVVTAHIARHLRRGQPGNSKGYGYVDVGSNEEVFKAIAVLDGKELAGRPIKVKALFGAQATEEQTKRGAAQMLPPASTSSPTRSTVLPASQPSQTSPRASHSYPTTLSSAPRPSQSHSRPLPDPLPATPISSTSRQPALSRPDKPAPVLLTPQPATLSASVPVASTSGPTKSQTVLFAADIGLDMDDAGLAALSKDAGIKVNDAYIIRNRQEPRESKGYGFVDVGSEEEQRKAIAALHGKLVAGRPISVKVAINRQQSGEEAKGNAQTISQVSGSPIKQAHIIRPSAIAPSMSGSRPGSHVKPTPFTQTAVTARPAPASRPALSTPSRPVQSSISAPSSSTLPRMPPPAFSTRDYDSSTSDSSDSDSSSSLPRVISAPAARSVPQPRPRGPPPSANAVIEISSDDGRNSSSSEDEEDELKPSDTERAAPRRDTSASRTSLSPSLSSDSEDDVYPTDELKLAVQATASLPNNDSKKRDKPRLALVDRPGKSIFTVMYHGFVDRFGRASRRRSNVYIPNEPAKQFIENACLIDLNDRTHVLMAHSSRAEGRQLTLVSRSGTVSHLKRRLKQNEKSGAAAVCALPAPNRFAASGFDHVVYQWTVSPAAPLSSARIDEDSDDDDVERGFTARARPLQIKHTSTVRALLPLSNNLLASGSADCSVHIFDMGAQTVAHTLKPSNAVTNLHSLAATHRHGILLEVAHKDLQFEIRDTRARRDESFARFGWLAGRTSGNYVRGSVRGEVFACGDRDGVVRVWDLRNTEEPIETKQVFSAVGTLAKIVHVVFDGGKLYALGEGNELAFMNTA